MRNPIILCLIAGWFGLAVLPWYGLVESFWVFGWLMHVADRTTAPAILQAALHGRVWLWPMFAALALPLIVATRPHSDRTAANVAILAGAIGFSWFFLQGFAIGLHGWNWAWLEAILGPVEPQPGAGYGALVAVSACLFLFTTGLAGRGVMRGDVFVVSSIGVVAVSIAVFVFFPVATILGRAAVDS